MAIVRVLSATGFASDDLFGLGYAAMDAPTAVPGNAVLVTSPAYGHAGTTALVFTFSSQPTTGPYSGGLNSVQAHNGGGILAQVNFAPAVPISWTSLDALNPDLFQFTNPSLPAVRFAGADDMQGNVGADIFRGYGGNDNLRGLGGNDTLIGGAGSDFLNGGQGGDLMVGGAGNDFFIVNAADNNTGGDRYFGGEANGRIAPGEVNSLMVFGSYDFRLNPPSFSQINRVMFGSPDSAAQFNIGQLSAGGLSPNLIVDGANGNQKVIVFAAGGTLNLSGFTFSNWTGGAFSGADNIDVFGSGGDDTLIGTSQPDILRGSSGNDTLIGGGGNDILDGDQGNDIYVLNAETLDSLGEIDGIDTIRTTISRTLTFSVIENLILDGGAAINGTGNAANNSIVGNGANNVLAGLDGNDVLLGGGGNDQLFGQAGKDSLTGGAGNDHYVIQSVAHTAAGNGDVVVDFDDLNDDRIDLTGIIPGVLTFIGQGAFTAANQVRFQQVGANVLVQINTAGPNTAEGEITLLNTTIGNAAVGQVNAADFLL
jgi:Ca2+-binding RTX toxin-like protein